MKARCTDERFFLGVAGSIAEMLLGSVFLKEVHERRFSGGDAVSWSNRSSLNLDNKYYSKIHLKGNTNITYMIAVST